MSHLAGMSAFRALCLLQVLVIGAYATMSMDPKVQITETYPESRGYRVYGRMAKEVTMNCFVENLPTESQVWWRRTMYDQNGRESTQTISKDMDIQDNNKWSMEKPTRYSWRLRIKAVAISDEGNYTCFVQTTLDNRIEANRTLFVTEKPEIIEALTSSDVTIREDEYIALTCNASGRPAPTLSWKRQGNAILPQGGVIRYSHKLEIEKAEFGHRGLYICEAANQEGEAYREIRLSVQFSPKITPDYPKVSQKIGYRRTLICHVEANPSPRVDEESNQLYWLRDNQRLETDGKRYLKRVLEGAYGRLTVELSILKVRKADFGTYDCRASNSMGTDTKSVTLEESDIVQPDKTGDVSSAHVTTVTMATLIMCLFAFLLQH